MSETYSTLFCSASGPFSANTPKALYDIATLQQEVLPSGSYVTRVFFMSGTYSASANLAVGWSGNNGAVVPTSAGINTGTLNSNGVSYVNPTGTLSTTSNQNLTLTTDGAVNSGTVTICIEYVQLSL